MKSNPSRSSGNVLFMILIAVALFAALSYAVTQSTTGASQSGLTKEQADSYAADILSWFSQLDTSVQRMRLVNNIPVEKFDFTDLSNLYQNGSPNNYINSYCTASNCQVFKPSGGGAPARKFVSYGDLRYNTGSASLRTPGHMTYQVLNIDQIGSNLNEVGVRIDYIKAPICMALNRRLGLPDCPTTNQTGSSNVFAGADLNAISTKLASSSVYTYSGDVAGKPTFCYCAGTPTVGMIWHVLIER